MTPLMKWHNDTEYNPHKDFATHDVMLVCEDGELALRTEIETDSGQHRLTCSTALENLEELEHMLVIPIHDIQDPQEIAGAVVKWKQVFKTARITWQVGSAMVHEFSLLDSVYRWQGGEILIDTQASMRALIQQMFPPPCKIDNTSVPFEH